MRSSLVRRLTLLERTLGAKGEWEFVIPPFSWCELPEDELERRIEEWRSGTDFEGMRSNVHDRRNATITLIRLVSLASDSSP